MAADHQIEVTFKDGSKRKDYTNAVIRIGDQSETLEVIGGNGAIVAAFAEGTWVEAEIVPK